MTKPLIAVPMQVENPDTSLYSIKKRYLASLKQAGCAVVVLPPSLTEDEAAVVLDRVDGLLLPGGGDVDPARYGAVVASPHCSPTPERDRLEAALIRQAAERDMPILGICRGMQIMNAALGGTLHRDLHACGVTAVGHRQEPPYERTTGSVTVAEGSFLACALGRAGLLPVNSMHHQAIDRVAPGLLVAARSDDRVIEAVEDPAHPFFLGIQWHPEYLASHRGLFHALADAACSEAAVA